MELKELRDDFDRIVEQSKNVWYEQNDFFIVYQDADGKYYSYSKIIPGGELKPVARFDKVWSRTLDYRD